ncbi:hypothetical protein BDY21DRAFT_365106 [Lineolata rhizophorae]|uniref:Uncharacterized protein n=1 Tax=Lineolata rhizophorae TaxID=578093 RepID=A0A6A6NWE0_9PEZI|nr:hypothetical protein BDY21DRAFT_365106 [Lineolata rhizophorae]
MIDSSRGAEVAVDLYADDVLERPREFLRTLARYRCFDAKDPRDKVHALRGVLDIDDGNTMTVAARQLDGIRPDYGIEVEEFLDLLSVPRGGHYLNSTNYISRRQSMFDAYWQSLLAKTRLDDFDTEREQFMIWNIEFMRHRFLHILGLCHYPRIICIGEKDESTEKGDRIALFKGGKTPLVIRLCQTTDRWLLVGDCYVHGAMDGAFWLESYTNCEDFWFI